MLRIVVILSAAILVAVGGLLWLISGDTEDIQESGERQSLISDSGDTTRNPDRNAPLGHPPAKDGPTHKDPAPSPTPSGDRAPTPSTPGTSTIPSPNTETSPTPHHPQPAAPSTTAETPPSPETLPATSPDTPAPNANKENIPEEEQVETLFSLEIVNTTDKTPMRDLPVTLSWRVLSHTTLSRAATTAESRKVTDQNGMVQFAITTVKHARSAHARVHLESEFILTEGLPLHFLFTPGTNETRRYEVETGGAIVEGKVVIADPKEGETLPPLSLSIGPDIGGTIRVGGVSGRAQVAQNQSFRFTGMRPGRYFVFGDENCFAGFEQRRRESFSVEAGKITQAPDIVFHHIPTFTGKAVLEDGSSLAGSTIMASYVATWIMGRTSARTDADGHFTVAIGSATPWCDFSLSNTSHLPIRLQRRDLDTAIQNGNDLGTLTFQGGAMVWGRVVNDLDGSPINGIQVLAEYESKGSARSWTDHFYQPVQAFTVAQLPEDLRPSETAEEGGWFVLRNVPRGAIRIDVRGDKGTASAEIDTTSGGVLGPIMLTVLPSTPLTGLVIWEHDGKPAAAVPVGLYSAGDMSFLTAPVSSSPGALPSASDAVTTTDKDGRFSFLGVAPGHYIALSQLRRDGKAWRALSAPVKLASAREAAPVDIQLSLKRLCELTVSVTCSNGADNLTAALYYSTGAQVARESGRAPLLLRTEVSPAAGELIVCGPNLAPKRISVPDTAGEQYALDVALEPRKGAMVTLIAPGSAAARAGIRPFDCIVRYAGSPVEDVKSLAPLVSAKAESREALEIVVIRDGKEQALTIVPGRLGVTLE